MGLAAIAAPLAIGGALIQGIGAINQGNAQAAAGNAQAKEAQQQDAIAAQNTKIAAEQSQSARLDQLNRTIGTIRATVSSRGLDPNSPSGMALTDAANTYAMRDVSRSNFNAWQTASNYTLAGQTGVASARYAGQVAQMAGYTSAAGSLFKAASLSNSTYGTS